MSKIPFPWLVFDVESIGLYGDPFAVGLVLMNKDGDIFRQRWYGCNLEKHPAFMWSRPEDVKWCINNIPKHVKDGNCTIEEMYSSFTTLLSSAIKQNYSIIADCPFPVEVNFLVNCERRDRTYIGPYPLYDVSSILSALGKDPMEEYPREEGQTKHHPMWDAYVSAKQLYTALEDKA